MADRKKNRIPAEPTDAFAALREEPKPAPRDPVVQEAINSVAAAGDALPNPGSQTDLSNHGNMLARDDNAHEADPTFEAQYQKALDRGMGYLSRRKVSGNRTGMIPPNCDIHPKLGAWGLHYQGRWMIIRWLDIRPKTRQKRQEQGWQYFEGREWCDRLGLVAEVYLNERGRIGYMDTELGWAPEEYIFEHRAEVEERRAAMFSTAKDRLLGQQSKYIPRVEILEGDDESVLGELGDRKRYAGTRS